MNFTENLILETDKVRLEPLSDRHLNELLPICLNHPGLLEYSPSPFGTEEKLREYFHDALETRQKQQRYPFAIFDRLNNRFVGSTSYGNFSFKDLRLEIGWTWIDKQSQGKGINAHSKYLLLAHAFDQLNMERVEFKTDSRNIRARTALEKIGAKQEGCLRSHTILLNGFRRDTAYYSILKDEWKGIKETIFHR